MGEGANFWRWSWRILAGACLLLAWMNVRERPIDQSGVILSGVEERSPQLSAVSRQISASNPQTYSSTIGSQKLKVEGEGARPRASGVAPVGARPDGGRDRRISRFKNGGHRPPLPGESVSDQTDAKRQNTAGGKTPPLQQDQVGGEERQLQSASPLTRTLKPIGYVERADGSAAAVIDEGGWVRIVHIGDELEDGFRVAGITASAVELMEAPEAPPGTPEGNGAPVLAELPSDSDVAPQDSAAEMAVSAQPPDALTPASRTAPASSHLPADIPIGIAESLSGPRLEPHRAADPPPSNPDLVVKPLGYVEWASGRVEAVLPDGDSVQLASVGDVYNEQFEIVEISPTSVEMVEKPLVSARPEAVPGRKVTPEEAWGAEAVLAKVDAATPVSRDGPAEPAADSRAGAPEQAQAPPRSTPARGDPSEKSQEFAGSSVPGHGPERAELLFFSDFAHAGEAIGIVELAGGEVLMVFSAGNETHLVTVVGVRGREGDAVMAYGLVNEPGRPSGVVVRESRSEATDLANDPDSPAQAEEEGPSVTWDETGGVDASAEAELSDAGLSLSESDDLHPTGGLPDNRKVP